MDNKEIKVLEAVEAVEEPVERPYTLRRLKDADLWPVLKIMSAVIPDDLAPIFAQVVSKEKSLKEVGIHVAWKIVTAILKNMHLVHDDVYALLSDVSGIPEKDIEEMPFGTTPMMIWDIVNNEKNEGFFKVVSKLS